MAKPPHRVSVHKQESTATGGDAGDADDMLTSPLEPHEDAINAGGVALQQPSGPAPGHSNDASAMIWRELGKMMFCDTENAGGLSLTALLVTTLFLDRFLTADLTVPGTKTFPTHDLEIADGVEITIEDGGEVLVL